MGKVDELVEWVAEGFEVGECAGCKGCKDGESETCSKCTALDRGRKFAKQILSHPDLYLHNNVAEVISPFTGVTFPDEYISLAEALKKGANMAGVKEVAASTEYLDKQYANNSWGDKHFGESAELNEREAK